MTRLLLEQELSNESVVKIEGDELHYLTRVRRHEVGDNVELQSVDGQRFEAVLKSLDAKEATLQITQKLPPAADCLPVNMLVSVPKGSLMDDVVRKLSELGVERITPIIAERTVVNPRQAKVHRWRKIAWESRRQCGRKTQLEVGDVVTLDKALSNCPDSSSKIILSPESTNRSSVWSNKTLTPPVFALIGPEGGFTDDELEEAAAKGFELANLGSTILRVETAAIATAVLCVAMLGGYD